MLVPQAWSVLVRLAKKSDGGQGVGWGWGVVWGKKEAKMLSELLKRRR